MEPTAAGAAAGDAIGIRSLATCFPETRTPAQELPERSALSPPERAVFDASGIESVATGAEAPAELAARAASRALERAGLEPGELDVLLMGQSRAPTHFMSSEATRLQEALGARGALALGVGELGCATVSAALLLGRALLRAREARHVLLAFASRPVGPRRYRHPVTINGDAGGALLLAREEGLRLLDVEVATHGRYWDLFRVDFRTTPPEEWREVCSDVRRYSLELAIESRNRFQAMSKAVLERRGLAWEQIDHFLMQNLSAGAFEFYERHFKVAVARCCRANLRDHGHLGSIDVIANLERGLESGELEAGQRALVLNNSPVAAWSCMLLEVPRSAGAGSAAR